MGEMLGVGPGWERGLTSEILWPFSADSLWNLLGCTRGVVQGCQDQLAGSALLGTSTCSPMRKLNVTRRLVGTGRSSS